MQEAQEPFIRKRSLGTGGQSASARPDSTEAFTDLRAVDHSEVSQALVAHGVSWAAVRILIWVRPALVQRAVVRVANFARAGRIRWVDCDANVRGAAFHDRQVISRAILAFIVAVAELEQRLRVPLASSAPLSHTRETHAGRCVRCRDRVRHARSDVDRGRHLDRVEGGGDLVERELLSVGAVVQHVDVEGLVLALFVVRMLMGMAAEWDCARQEG